MPACSQDHIQMKNKTNTFDPRSCSVSASGVTQQCEESGWPRPILIKSEQKEWLFVCLLPNKEDYCEINENKANSN